MSLGLSISLYLKRAPLVPLHRALWRTPVRLVPSAAVFQELYLGFTPAAMCLEAFLLPTSLLLTSLALFRANISGSPLLKYWIRKKRENKCSYHVIHEATFQLPLVYTLLLVTVTLCSLLPTEAKSQEDTAPLKCFGVASAAIHSFLPVFNFTILLVAHYFTGWCISQEKTPSPALTPLPPGNLIPLRANSKSGSYNLLVPNLKCLSWPITLYFPPFCWHPSRLICQNDQLPLDDQAQWYACSSLHPSSPWITQISLLKMQISPHILITFLCCCDKSMIKNN